MPDQGSTDSMENSVAAYVLGAAEPDEAASIRAHLASCRRCQELERRLRGVAAVMSLSAEEEAPPPQLRSRILAAASAAPEQERGAPLQRAMARSDPVRRPTPGLSAVTAALAAAVLALAGWNVYLTLQLRELRVLPAAHQMTPATGAMAGSSADVVPLQGRPSGLVALRHLPAPPPGKVYELWLVKGAGRMEPAGVFRPDQDGTRLLLLDRDLSGFRQITLTVEPGPAGSRSPTQAPVMQGSL